MADTSHRLTFQNLAIGFMGLSVLVLLVMMVVNPIKGQTGAPSADLSTLDLKAFHKGAPAGGEIPLRRRDQLSVDQVAIQFASLNYTMDQIKNDAHNVPRLFLKSLPTGLGDIKDIDQRKKMFFKIMLPMALRVNEDIRTTRAQVWRLVQRLKTGLSITPEDRIWLSGLYKRYKVNPGNHKALLDKIDTFPVSLILAQAAEESGWGASRFAKEGNALFGQWTFNPRHKGIVPKGRPEGKTYRIRAFDTLYESFQSYVLNLNSHRAYKELRTLRARLKGQNKPLTGIDLANALGQYSERGQDYISTVISLIENNDLEALNSARLDQGGPGDLENPFL